MSRHTLFKKMLRSCKLCCIKNTHDPIDLPHEVEVTVGRSQITNIKESSLSRNQIKLVANLDSYTVKVIPLGVNPSGVNGFSLKRNVEYALQHKDRLELLLDQFIHEIIFDPEPSNKNGIKEENNTATKRKADEELNNDRNKQNKTIIPIQKSNIWEEIDDKNLYIFTSEGVQPKEKIAGYDIDGTIITTKSGARFPKDASDWKFAFSEVPNKLRDINNDGYKVVFFTNQAGISNGKTKISDLKQKIEDINTKLNIPVQVFIAPTRTIYRKPAPGMWDVLCKKKNHGIEIDISDSFYVGDAAGRGANWAPKKKKDHSVADRLFALNLGLAFHTPEEHFLGARKVSFVMPVFDPRNDLSNIPLCEPKDSQITSDKREVIIMVGSPGSGKSFICKKYLEPEGYIHINRDTLGSWQKCCTALEKYIQEKKNVVVDNTNPDVESRKRYIDIAKKYSIPVRCFVMNTTVYQAKHNNLFREMTDKSHQQVTDIIINSYKNKYKEPVIQEGFQGIVKLNVIPKFEDQQLKDLYHMFLLEK